MLSTKTNKTELILCLINRILIAFSPSSRPNYPQTAKKPSKTSVKIKLGWPGDSFILRPFCQRHAKDTQTQTPKSQI